MNWQTRPGQGQGTVLISLVGLLGWLVGLSSLAHYSSFVCVRACEVAVCVSTYLLDPTALYERTGLVVIVAVG